MNIGSEGLALIKTWEGLRLEPYNDEANPPNATIGYGHKIHAEPVTEQDILDWTGFDEQHAEILLRSDCQDVVSWINANKPTNINLSQSQFDAIVSFGFNEGIGNLQRSTLWRKICVGDFIGAEGEFANWKYAGGKVSAGLIARRAAEAAMFAQSTIAPVLAMLAIGATLFFCTKNIFLLDVVKNML